MIELTLLSGRHWKRLDHIAGLHFTLPVISSGMPVRLKKLIGTVLLVTLVIVYALVATLFAVARLGDSGPVVQFSFFLVSGLLWVLPAMGIIKWMVKEPRPRD